ncbi:MAG: hypothetical protein RRC34_14145 [Lentisphaeria bacterium]|nr:hypothetical protein [Lentisphaeria bacterium]
MGLSENVLNPQIGMPAAAGGRQGIVSDVRGHADTGRHAPRRAMKAAWQKEE